MTYLQKLQRNLLSHKPQFRHLELGSFELILSELGKHKNYE